jgi:imidazole glycerol-phosphate synthase subunit HisF
MGNGNFATPVCEPRYRLIPKLEIKNGNLVKGIRLEGLRVLGDPIKFINDYSSNGADELMFVDPVASLYGRNALEDIVKAVSKNIFIPLTVGGGIRSLKDVETLLEAGADRVAINTAALNNPKLLNNLIEVFGSSTIVLSVEYKVNPFTNERQVYSSSGRDLHSIKIMDWIDKACEVEVGEILLTSISRDGTGEGLDLDFIKTVCDICPMPVIASGGIGNMEHVEQATQVCDGLALSSALHYSLINDHNRTLNKGGSPRKFEIIEEIIAPKKISCLAMTKIRYHVDDLKESL